jgi:hypothetical protein
MSSGSSPKSGHVPQKASASREIPKSLVKKQPLKASPVIVAGIVFCFLVAAASAIAPLVSRASHWWLALSALMLGIGVSAAAALRQP